MGKANNWKRVGKLETFKLTSLKFAVANQTVDLIVIRLLTISDLKQLFSSNFFKKRERERPMIAQ